MSGYHPASESSYPAISQFVSFFSLSDTFGEQSNMIGLDMWPFGDATPSADDPLDFFLISHPSPSASDPLASGHDLYLPTPPRPSAYLAASADQEPGPLTRNSAPPGTGSASASPSNDPEPMAVPPVNVEKASETVLTPAVAAPSNVEGERTILLPSDINAPSIPGSDIRRSARAVIPSKRSKQLNQIGDNTMQTSTVASGKENVPPAGPPVWVTLAKGHLLSRDLGDDWRMCVEVWYALEEKLGFGDVSGTKVSIDYTLKLCGLTLIVVDCPSRGLCTTAGMGAMGN